MTQRSTRLNYDWLGIRLFPGGAGLAPLNQSFWGLFAASPWNYFTDVILQLPLGLTSRFLTARSAASWRLPAPSLSNIRWT